jgi:hypothetical protein
MNRIVFAAASLALFGLAQPASAMMCGGGSQAQSSPGNTVTSGMMCGAAQAADDPMADKPAQQQRSSGMCPCCRNMAMMRGGMGGGGMGGGGMQHHNMPGMDMPKQ